MSKLFEILFNFFKPVIVVFTSLGAFIAFLLGALADPKGFANAFICGAIDQIASIFPSTPTDLTVAGIINNLGDSIPIVGRGILYDVFGSISAMAGLALVIKIYKLIPFKAT